MWSVGVCIQPVPRMRSTAVNKTTIKVQHVFRAGMARGCLQHCSGHSSQCANVTVRVPPWRPQRFPRSWLSFINKWLLFQRHKHNPWREVSGFISALQGQANALPPLPFSGRKEERHGSNGSEARTQPAVEPSPCGKAQGLGGVRGIAIPAPGPAVLWPWGFPACQGNLAVQHARPGCSRSEPRAGLWWLRPAGLWHSKARAARVGERVSPALPWKLAPVTHRNSSDTAEITGRKQVRAPSLSLGLVSKLTCSMAMALSSNSTFLPPVSYLWSLSIPLVFSDPQNSCFALARLSLHSRTSLPCLSCRQEQCSAPHCLPRVLVRPSNVNSPLVFPVIAQNIPLLFGQKQSRNT